MPHLSGNNPANDPDKKPVKGRSKFKPNRSLYQTMQFGLNNPHFAMEVVEGDSVSVRVASDVDTFSLKAPVMSPVRMHKNYYFAPLRAVLPNNAELLITNPLTGEDVDAEKVNAGVHRNILAQHITNVVATVNSALTKAQAASSTVDADLWLLAALVKTITYLEPFASDGSLLNVMGHSVGKSVASVSFSDGRTRYLDYFVDLLCERLRQDISEFTFNERVLTMQTGSGAPNYGTNVSSNIVVKMDLAPDASYGVTWSFRQFLEYLRQGCLVYQITIPSDGGMRADYDTNRRGLTYEYSPGESRNVSLRARYSSSSTFVNLGRLVAYQLANAQFSTEDTVDYIYNTNLWHQNQLALAQMATNGNTAGLSGTVFAYRLNGTQQLYDSVSSSVFESVLPARSLWDGSSDPANNTIAVQTTATTYVIRALGWIGYMTNLMNYTRSLKFRDYFCGSKAHPLAVGNVNVAVQSGQFSVVDVTKNIQMQRFLNQVNRVGRKFTNYVQGIYGTTPTRDPREVIFLGRTMDIIGAEETQNTGADQLTQPQTITSKLRKNSSQFAFEGSFSEPGYVIGITHFDVVRPYENVTDRAMFHADRFDMFNPYMQQIGDQEVMQEEIDPYSSNNGTPFGYQLRYQEYRMAVDRAVGGFREYLPGYAFVNHEGFYVNRSGAINISPDFIRSRPCEFDRFYISLTNYSLAGYFHFIIRQDVAVDASRPMEAAPSIL